MLQYPAANVVDAMLFGSTPPALPTGLNFNPSALPDVSSSRAYLRVAFTGVQPTFFAADWTSGAPTY